MVSLVSSTSPWITERRGDPLRYLDAWGVDGYDDLVALRERLKRERMTDQTPEWTLAYLAPLAPAPEASESYYAGYGDVLAPRARRRAAEAAERRRIFLSCMAQGYTVAQACEQVGVTTNTFRAWKERFPDFRNRVDRVKAGLAESEEVDESFVTRRRYYFGFETYTHQQLIIDAMEDTPAGGITLILLPPEAGKTTLLEDWVCDKIATDPNVRITYVSEAAEGWAPAAKVLSTVKERMTDPTREDQDAQYETHIPEWISRYGPFRDDTIDKDKPWNAKYMKVHRASGRRDYTFQAVSWRSRIYGTRCDWMIFDDVQSDEGINLTEKMLSRFRKTFFNRPGKDGHIVFIGTRVGVGDVYEKLAEEIPDHMIRIVQIPALDEHGNSYCPEMWPEDALEAKRSIVGEDGWTTAYMMAPQEAGVTTFTEEMLDRARDPNRVYGIKDRSLVSLTLAGIDPALGGGNALVAAQTTSKEFRILAAEVDYRLARNEEIIARIKQFCRYGFDELVIERNSQQRGLARDDRLREVARTFGFRLTEHETGRNKWDFIFGVGAMAGSFIREEITFPDATPRCRRNMEALRAELLAWRPNIDAKLLRQDLVMALWFPWYVWTQRRKRMAKRQAWETRGTPWRPGDMSGQWAKPRRRSLDAIR